MSRIQELRVNYDDEKDYSFPYVQYGMIQYKANLEINHVDHYSVLYSHLDQKGKMIIKANPFIVSIFINHLNRKTDKKSLIQNLDLSWIEEITNVKFLLFGLSIIKIKIGNAFRDFYK